MSVYHGFTAKQLAVEYSPSSCVDDINVFIQQYIDMSASTKSSAIASQTVIADLSYDKAPAQVLDLYIPTVREQKKLQVYIHGGYWQELSKEESSFAAHNFQSHGVHFAVLNYTLAPHASITEIVAECAKAITWLYENAEEYGYYANEIYLSGSSAGAHLATMVALNAAIPIKGVCAVSGIYDLTPIKYTYINDPLQLTSTEIAKNSPLFHLAHWPKNCDCLLAYGDNETSEFKRQTAEFHHQLKRQGFHTALYEITARNHFNVILDLADKNSVLFQQMLRQMNIYETA